MQRISSLAITAKSCRKSIHSTLLSVYKDADDYKDVSDILTNNQAEITDIIRAVIQSHSSDNISEDVIKKEALEQIQQHLDSKAVKKVMLTNFMYQ